MKLRMTCPKCRFEPTTAVSVDLRDDGLYTVRCLAGHTELVSLQNQLFELLFDVGAQAILDGYQREAVSCFSASLERFYEFYSRVVLRAHGVAKDVVASSWRPIASHSERELGAFVALYVLENGKPPILLAHKWREFRNKVIHQGHIPEPEQAESYGGAVFDLIVRDLRELLRRRQKEIGESVHEHLMSVQERAGQPVRSGLAISTIIDLKGIDHLDFRAAFEAFRRGSRSVYRG